MSLPRLQRVSIGLLTVSCFLTTVVTSQSLAVTTDVTADVITVDTTTSWQFDFTDETINDDNETTTDDDFANYTTVLPSTTVLKPPETPPVTTTRYVTGIVMTLIMIVAVFGNVTVLTAMHKTRSLQRVNTMMYASLAASDLCRTVICMPFFTFALYSNKWNLPDASCPVYHLFYITMRFICVLNLTVISIERAFIINRPMTYQRVMTSRKMKFVILVVWIVSFLYGTLNSLWFILDGGAKPATRDVNIPCRYTPAIQYAIFDFCLTFVLPLIIIFIMYAQIFSAVSYQMKRVIPKIHEPGSRRNSDYPREPTFFGRSRTNSGTLNHALELSEIDTQTHDVIGNGGRSHSHANSLSINGSSHSLDAGADDVTSPMVRSNQLQLPVTVQHRGGGGGGTSRGGVGGGSFRQALRHISEESTPVISLTHSNDSGTSAHTDSDNNNVKDNTEHVTKHVTAADEKTDLDRDLQHTTSTTQLRLHTLSERHQNGSLPLVNETAPQSLTHPQSSTTDSKNTTGLSVPKSVQKTRFLSVLPEGSEQADRCDTTPVTSRDVPTLLVNGVVNSTESEDSLKQIKKTASSNDVITDAAVATHDVTTTGERKQSTCSTRSALRHGSFRRRSSAAASGASVQFHLYDSAGIEQPIRFNNKCNNNNNSRNAFDSIELAAASAARDRDESRDVDSRASSRSSVDSGVDTATAATGSRRLSVSCENSHSLVSGSHRHTQLWAHKHFNRSDSLTTVTSAAAAPAAPADAHDAAAHATPRSESSSASSTRTAASDNHSSGNGSHKTSTSCWYSWQLIKRNKAIKLTIAVVGTFILCWAPFEITFLVELACATCVGDILWFIVNTMAFMSSAINPFVYSLYSNEFRRAVKKLLRCHHPDPMRDIR